MISMSPEKGIVISMKKNLSKYYTRIRNFTVKNSLWERVWLFPILAMWLELFVHIFDGNDLRFAPIYLVFAISYSLLFTAISALMKPRTAKNYSKVMAVILTVSYGAEFIAKTILQTYYPLSSMKTAAENHLYQFIDVIFLNIGLNLHKLIILFIPAIYIIVFGRFIFGDDIEKEVPHHLIEVMKTSKYKAVTPKMLLAGSILGIFLFHYLGLGLVHLPWGAGVRPKDLYYSDTDYNYQNEQLGMYNMLRLDIIHTLVPSTVRVPDTNLDIITGPGTEDPKTPDSGETVTTEGAIDQPPAVDRSPNAMDIDFDAIAAGTSNKDVKWLCDYFGSIAPTNKNEYTGMFKGYNVIFITMEAFDYLAVSEEYTPTLYRLMHEGFVFNNFYSALHFTSTSNGECQHLLGLYPKNGQPISMARTGELGTNCYFSLAQQLGRLGYNNYGYHNNWDLYERADSHRNLGYNWRWCGRGMLYEADRYGNLKWPQRDSFMIEHSTDLDDWLTSDKPFNIYYLTVSGHTPYSWNWVCNQHKELLEDAPWTETTKAYVATVVEVDKAMEVLLQKLEDAGKLENTLIIASPDHVPYTAVENMGELAGRDFGTSEAAAAINERVLDLELYRNGLIIWSASMKEPVQVDKVCCQVDILPTVSNLLGLEYDSRMLSGTDILSDSEGLVVFSSRCWRTDKGFFDRFTETFTPNEGVEMSEEETKAYVDRFKTIASCRLNMTARIIENNFYSIVFGEEGRVKGSLMTEKTGAYVPPAEPETKPDNNDTPAETETSGEAIEDAQERELLPRTR